MRAPTQVGRRPIGFNMTPMIDIVFLLLIFYLVSNTMQRDQQERGVTPPASTIGQPQDAEGRHVVFNVFADGRMRVAGQDVPEGELLPLLQVENQKAGGRLKVRIRGDRNVQYRNVEPILLACARAGVWDVVFAVTRPAAAPGN